MIEIVCGTCRHCKMYQGDWMCYNRDSEYYCCYCEYDDTCEEWEARER